jgi:HPt (histidine-containing phosphotransfer) domain-containing protein
MTTKRRNTTRAEALAALESRIEQLRLRLEHAKLAEDQQRIESVAKKLALAIGRIRRLRRKLR